MLKVSPWTRVADLPARAVEHAVALSRKLLLRNAWRPEQSTTGELRPGRSTGCTNGPASPACAVARRSGPPSRARGCRPDTPGSARSARSARRRAACRPCSTPDWSGPSCSASAPVMPKPRTSSRCARWARTGAALAPLRRWFAVPAPRTVFGVRFPNPVGLAAGMDKNGIALPGWAALVLRARRGRHRDLASAAGQCTAPALPAAGQWRPDTTGWVSTTPGRKRLRTGCGRAGRCPCRWASASASPRSRRSWNAVDDYRSSLRVLYPYGDYFGGQRELAQHAGSPWPAGQGPAGRPACRPVRRGGRAGWPGQADPGQDRAGPDRARRR